jgi:hypothetical protein
LDLGVDGLGCLRASRTQSGRSDRRLRAARPTAFELEARSPSGHEKPSSRKRVDFGRRIGNETRGAFRQLDGDDGADTKLSQRM